MLKYRGTSSSAPSRTLWMQSFEGLHYRASLHFRWQAGGILCSQWKVLWEMTLLIFLQKMNISQCFWWLWYLVQKEGNYAQKKYINALHWDILHQLSTCHAADLEIEPSQVGLIQVWSSHCSLWCSCLGLKRHPRIFDSKLPSKSHPNVEIPT